MDRVINEAPKRISKLSLRRRPQQIEVSREEPSATTTGTATNQANVSESNKSASGAVDLFSPRHTNKEGADEPQTREDAVPKSLFFLGQEQHEKSILPPDKLPLPGRKEPRRNGRSCWPLPSSSLEFQKHELDQLPSFPSVDENRLPASKKKRNEQGKGNITVPFVHPDRSQEKARYGSSSARKNGFIARDAFFSHDTWD